MCAFDDVSSLSQICKKHNIWLHLDGAFGGSVIFSEKYKRLVDGIESTDSFCFNAHKTLGAQGKHISVGSKTEEKIYIILLIIAQVICTKPMVRILI